MTSKSPVNEHQTTWLDNERYDRFMELVHSVKPVSPKLRRIAASLEKEGFNFSGLVDGTDQSTAGNT